MSGPDPVAPSPAPPPGPSTPSAALGSASTGAADAWTPPLPSPVLERDDGPDPAAPAAGTVSAEAVAIDQSRPEHDGGPALLQLGPGRADACENGPVGTETNATGRNAAQDLLSPGE